MVAAASGEEEDEMEVDVLVAVVVLVEVAGSVEVVVTKDLPAKSLVRFLMFFDDSHYWFVLLLPIKLMN